MIKNLLSGIIGFAKRKPGIFFLIVLAIIFLLLYITYESLHLTSTPKFCGMCHVDAPSGAGGESYTWEKNVHSYRNVTCIDCHGKPGLVGYLRAKMGGMVDLYNQVTMSAEEKKAALSKSAENKDGYALKLVPKDRCMFCHTDEGNKNTRDNTVMSFLGVKMRFIDGIVNPDFRTKMGLPDIFKEAPYGVNPNHSLHVKDLDLSCLNCHLGVAHGGAFHNKPKMETCFACHDERRADDKKMPANDNCVACHKIEKDKQEGKFLESKGISESPWVMPEETTGVTCDSCHEDAVTRPTAQKCLDCHEEDKAYEDMFNDWQKTYAEQKAELDTINMNFYKLIKDNKMNDEQLKKFNEFNYLFTILELDGSKGVHNSDLMTSIYDKAKAIAEELQNGLGSTVKK